MEEVILVDKNDNVLGSCEKLLAHETLQLHRAFSVFIFNTKGEFLLQQRALDKYHSGGLWTNSCCSHPRPNETTLAAGVRRLQEEIGLAAELRSFGHLVYKVAFDNGLGEHEYDHLLYGVTNALPVLNPAEANQFRYASLENIVREINEQPEEFTFWFKAILSEKKASLVQLIEQIKAENPPL